MILAAIGIGHVNGYTVMEVTVPGGTVYPALRRLSTPGLGSLCLRSHEERTLVMRPGGITRAAKRHVLLVKLFGRRVG
jgi:hypothetical protein